MNDMLTAALDLAARGFYVIPTAPNGTQDRKHPEKPSKAPLTGFKWQDEANGATRDPERIRQIWTANPTANVAIRMGQIAGVYVVDVDVKNGVNGFASLKAAGIELPPTLADRTWSGGRHFYFKHTTGELPLQSQNVNGLAGIDVRGVSEKDAMAGTVGDGGYCIVAPSVLNGKPYQWTTPLDTPLAEFPEALKKRMGEENKPKKEGATQPNADLFTAAERRDEIAAKREVKSDDFSKVKAAVGIRQYLTDCGYSIRGNRTKATWRGGDGYTVSIDPSGRTWYDPKAAAGGSVIDLCMLIENLDKAAALHALADRYGVTLDGTKTAKRRHRAEQLPPLTVSWRKVCIHVQYGNGRTQSKELRLNPNEVKCYNALARICGTARPIPLDLFDEALALVMKKHLAAKGGRK